jgi:hypothetical protein
MSSVDMTTSNIEPELNSLLNKLTVEIESDQKEIEIRKKRIEKNEVLLRAVRGSLGVTNASKESTGYGTKAETVKLAIQQIQKPRFTQDDVEAEIKRVNPNMVINRNRIRATLWTLQDRNELIRQVRAGSNRQPAEFEKLASQANGVKIPTRRLIPTPTGVEVV